MNAQFHVVFEYMDYEHWVAECGAEFQKLEPRLDGGFNLHIAGNPDSIECFARDLGWNAE